MFMYTKEQKRLLIDLINEANPGLNLAPLALDNARLGVPWSRTPGPGEIADTSIEVYPRDNTFFIGKVIVHYRRLDVAKLFAHKVLRFDRWRENNVTTEDLVKWINDRYQTRFVLDDFGTASWSSSTGVRTRNIMSGSLCYQGTLSFIWDKGKRALDQIIETNEFDGRIWDERHGGETDSRPLLMFTGFGGDFTDFKTNLNQLPSGRVVDGTEGNLRLALQRYNELYGTDLSVDIDHTEPNGLKGLGLSRVTLPSTAVPEANAGRFARAVVLSSQENSWFGGRLILHYEKKVVIEDSGFGPKQLEFGDAELGFYGELAPGTFYSADEMSQEVQYSDGSIFSSDPGWFKFAYKGKVLLVPKGNLRNVINWQSLYQAGLIYGTGDAGLSPSPSNSPVPQNKSIYIDGVQYRVRVLRGSVSDPESGPGGEWDDLIGRMVNGEWGDYNPRDLDIDSGTGNSTLCMESDASGNGAVVRGGSSGTSWYGIRDKNEGSYSQYRGWRPVLEMVTD